MTGSVAGPTRTAAASTITAALPRALRAASRSNRPARAIVCSMPRIPLVLARLAAGMGFGRQLRAYSTRYGRGRHLTVPTGSNNLAGERPYGLGRLAGGAAGAGALVGAAGWTGGW